MAKSYHSYAGFNGDIQQWYFMAGEGTWEVPDVTECEDPTDDDCTIFPTDDSSCVILYSECNYSGDYTKICEDTPFTDIDYEVYSIEVPESKTIYLYNQPCFNGQVAIVTQSQECLTQIDFTDLLSIGVKLMDVDASVRKSPGALQAKFNKPSLRKPTILKTFKKH